MAYYWIYMDLPQARPHMATSYRFRGKIAETWPRKRSITRDALYTFVQFLLSWDGGPDFTSTCMCILYAHTIIYNITLYILYIYRYSDILICSSIYVSTICPPICPSSPLNQAVYPVGPCLLQAVPPRPIGCWTIVIYPMFPDLGGGKKHKWISMK